MKTRILAIIALFFLCIFSISAQSPGLLNYQGVARDAGNEPYTNQLIGLRFTILNGSAIAVYTETQSHTTNEFGLINTTIGGVSPASFEAVDWGNDSYSLKVELDLGNDGSWEIEESKALNSVPYALYGEDADANPANELQTLGISGNQLSISSGNTIDLPTGTVSPWLATGSDIYYSGGLVGIGTMIPESKLHIVSPPVTGPESILKAIVEDDPNSFFEIRNGTISDDKFMPAITGNNGTDHRQGLFVMASTTELLDDLGGYPLMTFESRKIDGPIINRPLFQWASYGNIKMTMLANGNLGIGTATPASKLHIEGGPDWTDEDPLFEVRNKSGIPIFAVYNNGVRVLVNHIPDAKARTRGGFVVGGFDMDKAGYHETFDLMRITPDSVRFNIDNSAVTKAPGTRGGFAVGGFDRDKKGTINEDFMYLTPQSSESGEYNTFMGYRSGYNTAGIYPYSSFNTFIGYETGYNNTIGLGNVFFGWNAGYSNISGASNVFLGASSGARNTTGVCNTSIGTGSGRNLTSGQENVLIGYNTANNQDETTNLTGNSNIAIGTSFKNNTTGSANVCVGAGSGNNNSVGDFNVMLGPYAGRLNSTGDNNVCVGGYSGYNLSGSNNVLIGNRAGYNATGANYMLAIEGYGQNYTTEESLIYGDFYNRDLTLNSDVFVDGSFSFSGKSSQISDINLKTNISELTAINDKLKAISGYCFDWNSDAVEKYKVDNSRQIGVLAQEIEAVFPELVSENKDGYKTVDYSHLSPILLQAVKEQQEVIEDQDSRIVALENELSEIKTLLSTLLQNQE